MQIYNCVNQGVKWTPARWPVSKCCNEQCCMCKQGYRWQ